ncbi:MAG: YihA family ribosome biogenesis GTP-binding protein [Alphaproteobacteria bacterium]|nr:YihA family ribosome biogenesis GTP-binding protein [Alphaproteobacteria bacterium]
MAAVSQDQADRWFSCECEFVMGCTSMEHLPVSELPEIAFAGRSNVGKSSLVNGVTGRKALARTSNTPGHTRQLNFFRLGGALMLVDLPGYGYAKAPKDDINAWTMLTRDYLRGRQKLRRVYLLIDSRHGIKDTDRQIMKLLDECATSYQIVLTKCDKLKPAEIEAQVAAVQEAGKKHSALHPAVLATSSETGFGLTQLRQELLSFLL